MNENDNPASLIFRHGCQVLGPILSRHGFAFVEGLSGTGHGAPFASGAYVKGDRKLEVHFRISLGLVTYHIGKVSLSHEDYMRVVAQGIKHHYPGFSDDPLDGFRRLAYDLENFCHDFLAGDAGQFKRACQEAKERENLSGMARLARDEQQF